MRPLDLKVIDNFIGLIDPEQLSKRTSKKIATTVWGARGVDSILNSSVVRKYNVPQNMTTKAVVRGRMPSDPAKAGKYIYKHGIVYKYKSIPLSRFMVDDFIGNLIVHSRPKKKVGLVHRVQVLRNGGPKVVVGKRNNNGGFIPRIGTIDGPKAKNKSYPRLGITMWERLGPTKFEIAPLRGPSISQMINKVWDEDPRLRDRVTNYVLKRLVDL